MLARSDSSAPSPQSFPSSKSAKKVGPAYNNQPEILRRGNVQSPHKAGGVIKLDPNDLFAQARAGEAPTLSSAFGPPATMHPAVF